MDVRNMGFDSPLFSVLEDMLDFGEEPDQKGRTNPFAYPNSYTFVVDMPGIKAGEIKVLVENENVLVASGERKREKEEGAKYVRVERRVGKFMRRFMLPDNANMDKISAVSQDGVLTVTVEKLPLPEPRPRLLKSRLLENLN